MRYLSDYHMHSKYSFDAVQTIEQAVGKAISMNINEICLILYSLKNYNIESVDKIVKKVRTDFSEEIKNEEIMLPFEFIIGSLFPSSYNAVKDAMTQQYIEGYNKGYEEGKNNET